MIAPGESTLTNEFTHPPDAGLLWRILTSRHWLPVVSAADECNVFMGLEAYPAGAEELAERTDLDRRAIRAVLAMLASLELLVFQNGQFHLSPAARRFLLQGSEHYWGPVLKAEACHDPLHASLVSRLRQRPLSVHPDKRRQPFDQWDQGTVNLDFAARIARFMHPLSLSEAPFVARHASLDGIGRLLDVGGGAGSLAIEIARARPEIRCTVMDLDGMCAQAAELIAAAGVNERVDTCARDMFREPWPAGYDGVLMSNVLHDWSEPECAELARRAFQILPREGRVFLHEALLDEGGAGPIAPAGLSVRMLLDTRGQQFTFSSLRDLLEWAGFSEVQRHDVSNLYSLVIGRKLV